MRISSINGTNPQSGQMGVQQANDSYSRNIQRQIANAQKQLQELSSNEELSMEEKMKKRQEIQKQITDLNNQLRQHQIELRREATQNKQQEKGSSMEDMLGGTRKAGTKTEGSQGSGLSQAGMKAMISADSAIDQAQVQGSVAAGMEGRAGVLESEIKLDAVRGCSVEAKEEELAEVEQKAAEATASQVNTLEAASREMEEAQEEERTEGIREKKADKEEQAQSKGNKAEAVSKPAEEAGDEEDEDTVSEKSGTENGTAASQPAYYTSVDIRL